MKSLSDKEHRWYRASEISSWTERQLEDYYRFYGLEAKEPFAISSHGEDQR